ncbi:MAG: pyridoxal-phosphate dependent enzyme [Sporolactobacillus sp.]|nr:pyridoxal-phosphate dependent enzyme [Sporolactobacillus sp.]
MSGYLRECETIGDLLQLTDIEQAAACLKPVVHRTPLVESATFNALTGARLHFKLENLQRTGSFKLRGAYNKIYHLSPAESARGIVTASAGNHAQGVALSAARRKLHARIFMPKSTPLPKVKAVQSYGAEAVLVGTTYQDAYQAARQNQRTSGITFVHAFDDEQVIAGQATVAMEMLQQCPQLEMVVVPVGGGGLAAGTAYYLKQKRPDIAVVGVQSDYAPAVYNLYHHVDKRSSLGPGGIAEGILVSEPGWKTCPLLTRYLDDVVTVSDRFIARAMVLMLERSKLFVEGAGAAPLAAVLSKQVAVRGKHVGLIVSGGNADPRLFPTLETLAYEQVK